jgi:long-chain acyl-CoA synthetase
VSELGFWRLARARPDAVALTGPEGEAVTAGALLRRCDALAHALRSLGVQRGDAVAMMLPNGVALYEVFLAVAQIGVTVVPINHHLVAREIAWILEDSGAKALFTHPRFAAVAAEAARAAGLPEDRWFVVAPVDGWGSLDGLIAAAPEGPVPDRSAGGPMYYTSGTTGRPKGVRRPSAPMPPDDVGASMAGFLMLFGIQPLVGVHIVVAPLYHTAVLNFSTSSLHLGHTVVVMERFDPEATLAAIERHRVTHAHLVPTQFSRMLALPDEVKARYDVSSLRQVIHSAAPCPPDVKRRMLAWWGPVIHEYYAATEGGGTSVGPEDWLRRPGTVGRAWPGSEVVILDDDGAPLPARAVGTVWMRMGSYTFAYHKDGEKTDKAWRQGFFTVGDAGYLDEDGWLFLCDRKADMIIRGGVNLYPAEIEAALHEHPSVGDVAVFGVPHPDLGESVLAIVEPATGVAGSPELASELLTFAAERLAKFKLPSEVRFLDRLPRDPNGKLYKRALREPFWEGVGRRI